MISRKYGHSCIFSIKFVRGCCIISSVDRLFWPIIVYCIYIAFGPWMYCEVAGGKYGLIYAWGIWIDGHYLYGSLTYLYAAFQFLTCQLPMVCICTVWVSRRFEQIMYTDVPQNDKCCLCCRSKMTDITFYVIILIELAHTILLAVIYDAIAVATSIIRTWSMILYFYLWYFSRKLPKNALK